MLDYQANDICARIVKNILDSTPETEREAKAKELARSAGADPLVSSEFAEHVLGYPSFARK